MSWPDVRQPRGTDRVGSRRTTPRAARPRLSCDPAGWFGSPVAGTVGVPRDTKRAARGPADPGGSGDLRYTMTHSASEDDLPIPQGASLC